ncbi:hypothetical protein V1511DRAFT_495418 [Dipodascopsis uninucleata]
MTSQTEIEKLILERVSINELGYRKLLKKIQALPGLRFVAQDEILNARRELELEFSSLELSLWKAQLQKDVNTEEVSNYESQKTEIKHLYEHGSIVTENLESEFADAQRQLARLQEYDKFARTMTEKDRLATRADQTAAIEALEAEIQELEIQKNEYAHVWVARRRQFAEIMGALQGMQTQIREEKEEQERIEGLEEESKDEAVSSQTPNPGTPTPGDKLEEKDYNGELESSVLQLDSNQNLRSVNNTTSSFQTRKSEDGAQSTPQESEVMDMS